MRYWNKPWGLVQGCTPVSKSCRFCWSASESHMRSFQKNPKIREQYEGLTYLKDRIPTFNGIVRFREDRLDIPLKIKKPQVFAIWSDLFHEKVTSDFIIEAFERMEFSERHTFLVLTKRPERIASVLFGQEGDYYMGGGDYIPNVWLGTTVENQAMVERIPLLISGADQFKIFLSLEPLLSGIDLSRIQTNDTIYPLTAVNQIIVGAESGQHRRPCNIEWIRAIVEQARIANIKIFVKQIQDKNGKIIRNINEFPEDLRIRELAW